MKYGNIHTPTPRDLARKIALDILSWQYQMSGKMGNALKANRVQFLYFHHVFQDEEDAFRGLIAKIALSHQFIGYSEAVNRILKKEFDRPYIAVSFDDGIKNCLQASRIMDEYGVKGCFFVCPPILGERNEVKLAAFSKQLEMPPLDYLDWDDVGDLLKRGHEVGGHTVTHANLANASSAQLSDEIGGSYEMLKRKNSDIVHFAWPFGRFSHFSPTAAKAVFDCGYKSCASAERGCHVAGVEDARRLCIRRDSTIASWPVKHVNYFMAKNLERAAGGSETWPDGWTV